MTAPTSHPVAILPRGEQRGILVHGLFTFAAVGGLALFAAARAIVTGGYQPSSALSLPYLLAVFVLSTLLLLLALKTVRNAAFFEIFFTVAMLSGAWFIADLFLSPGLALIVGSALVLVRFLWKTPLGLNLSLGAGVAGISASLGADLTPNALLVFLTVLSFYDIVAVYRTGHMVRMFRGLSSRGVIFAFILTPLRFRSLTSERPELQGMFLGTGDVALPVMLSCAALRVGTIPAVASLAGAAAGFAVMYMLFLAQPRRAPMPALPPIALGSILGYLLSLLILRA